MSTCRHCLVARLHTLRALTFRQITPPPPPFTGNDFLHVDPAGGDGMLSPLVSPFASPSVSHLSPPAASCVGVRLATPTNSLCSGVARVEGTSPEEQERDLQGDGERGVGGG